MPPTKPIRIFLSRPNWVPPPLQAGLDGFTRLLADMGLEPLTLGVTQAARQNPMREVVRLVDSTYGMIVLGLPQIELTKGAIKADKVTDKRFPSEWNHIEGAVGYARGRPLLFLRERGVIDRGMLDAASLGLFTFEIDGADPRWADAALLRQAVSDWKTEVEACRRRTISFDGLRVLRYLEQSAGRGGVESRIIRRDLGNLDVARLRRVLGKLIAAGLVADQPFENAVSEYSITERGRTFLEGFQMGAPLNHL